MRILVAVILAPFLLAGLSACGDDADEAIPTDEPSTSPTPTLSSPPSGTAGTEDITWDEAVELLEDCRITGVMQAHSRDIWITLDDGTERHAVEPGIDDVFGVIEGLEPGCAPKSIATE
jgi:hypothetical protein